MAATILIVEDEHAVARGLQYALEQEGYEVTLARSGEEGLEAATRDAPDLVLLDVRLPGMDGFEVLRRLRAAGTKSPVLMLTARDEEVDKVIGLELGADDYVVKPFSSAELIARMRAILRRTEEPADAPRGPVRIGELEVDERSRRASLRGRELELTLKEFDLLARLVRDAGSVVRREDLMTDVWDENWFGSMKTLDVHVSTLRRKLEDDPALPRYLHTVRGVGFRFVSEQEFEE